MWRMSEKRATTVRILPVRKNTRTFRVQYRVSSLYCHGASQYLGRFRRYRRYDTAVEMIWLTVRAVLLRGEHCDKDPPSKS